MRVKAASEMFCTFGAAFLLYFLKIKYESLVKYIVNPIIASII